MSEWDYDFSHIDNYYPDPHNVSLLLRFSGRAVDRERDEREAQQEAKKRANSRLCHRCQKVEFQAKILDRRSIYTEPYSLGPLKEVLARIDCPLCRLTVAAVSEAQREVGDEVPLCPFGVDPSDEVELDWDPKVGFMVNLAMPGCRISFIESYGDEDTVQDTDEDETLLRRARILSKSIQVWSWSGCQDHHSNTHNPPIHDVTRTFRSSFLASIRSTLLFASSTSTLYPS